MADGSLRITFEFEPSNAAQAFALFGARGRNVAIAALKDGHGSITDEPTAPTEPAKNPIGPLCMLAVQWCRDPMFWQWLETDPANSAHSEQSASACVMSICEIDSRRELDSDPEAAGLFHKEIRGPYSKWLAAKGVVA